MTARIEIRFVVPLGYEPGDYAVLHGNSGDGGVDWDTPLTGERFDLFPRGAGIYGFGLAPWGAHRFGDAHCMRTAGFGDQPWGLAPFAYGTAVVTAVYAVTTCGDYAFGFACYDAGGNPHTGEPGEVAVAVHIAPPPPTGLKKNSYNAGTGVLVLDAL